MVAITTAAYFAQFYEVHISWLYSSTTSDGYSYNVPSVWTLGEGGHRGGENTASMLDGWWTIRLSLKHMTLKWSKSTFLIWLTKGRLFSSLIIKLQRIKTTFLIYLDLKWISPLTLNWSVFTSNLLEFGFYHVPEVWLATTPAESTFSTEQFSAGSKLLQIKLLFNKINLTWISKIHGFNCPVVLQPVIILDIHTQSGGRKRHKGSWSERHVTWLTLSLFPKDQNQCWK